MARLSARGLTVSYRGQQVLEGIDFDAAARSVTCVVGANGVGKSTLLKAIAGLVTPDGGEITLGGRPIAQAQGSVAYLGQSPALSWHYPAQVRDVVAMGRFPHRRLRRLRAADRDAVTEALRQVGMEELAKAAIADLSGGQRQRVLVGRALAQQAKLLLLDEPFAALDADTVSLLCEVLRATASAGATVVIVSHEPTVLPRLCDRLVRISRRPSHDGTMQAVLTVGSLAVNGGSLAFGVEGAGSG